MKALRHRRIRTTWLDARPPHPRGGRRQVRVRVATAGVNPFDSAVIQGHLKDGMEHRFPLVPRDGRFRDDRRLQRLPRAAAAGVVAFPRGLRHHVGYGREEVVQRA